MEFSHRIGVPRRLHRDEGGAVSGPKTRDDRAVGELLDPPAFSPMGEMWGVSR
jgi:hypothetical protein